jgi:F-type H+-transporting ATPase subunit c
MKRSFLSKVVLALSTLALASPAWAQEAGGANQFNVTAMAVLAAGLAIGIAGGLCGLGQGKAVAAACEGTARNPNAGKQIFTLTLVGLAFIESLTIYALVVSFSLMP